jgi:hypothetical protein
VEWGRIPKGKREFKDGKREVRGTREDVREDMCLECGVHTLSETWR